MSKKIYDEIINNFEDTNFCIEHLVFDGDRKIFMDDLENMLYDVDLSKLEYDDLVNEIELMDYEDDNEYICEVCGNSVYIEGDIGCFICPECGAAQNI